MRILNRITHVLPEGVMYEADPRHTDILVNSLGLSAANATVTPGVKEHEADPDVQKSNESDEVPMVQPKPLEPAGDSAHSQGGVKMGDSALSHGEQAQSLSSAIPTGGRMSRALTYIRALHKSNFPT